MNKIEQDLNLPKIGGWLIASHIKFDKQDKFKWNIEFKFAGPDARYNPAGIKLSSRIIPKLIEFFQFAYKTMETLDGKAFKGTYSKDIVKSDTLLMKVVSKKGNVNTEFYISSSTFRFSRILNMHDVRIIIRELKTLEHRGNKMIQELKEIVKELERN